MGTVTCGCSSELFKSVAMVGGGGGGDGVQSAKLGGEKKNPALTRATHPRVGVFGGWEISDPHPCLWQPVPVTRDPCGLANL